MQSLYEDFAAAFGRMQKRRMEWEEAHRRFAGKLVAGLCKHGMVPERDGFEWMPPDRQVAIAFGEDGRLHVKFRLLVGDAWASIRLRIRRDGDQWEVAHGETRRRFSEADEAARHEFYDAFFAGLIAWLDNLEDPRREPEVGFRAS